jgi:hypothetical protein
MKLAIAVILFALPALADKTVTFKRADVKAELLNPGKLEDGSANTFTVCLYPVKLGGCVLRHCPASKSGETESCRVKVEDDYAKELGI